MAKRKQKWLQIQVKTIKYFETISIPGISRIVNTNSFYLKILWTIIVFVIFALGFHNISQAVTDYYKFDKITNIERINSKSTTFPGITICASGGYNRKRYINGSVIDSKRIDIRTDKTSRIKNFIDFKSTNFSLFKQNVTRDVANHFEFFKIPDDYDCLRFNGATNKSLELFKAFSTVDAFNLWINHFYVENISPKEYFTYSFETQRFYAYFKDNRLDSFENIEPHMLEINNDYEIDIEKTLIEIRLPEPYNQCKESSADDPNHQPNCIASCVYRLLEEKYKCTFHSSLFTIAGLDQCGNNYLYRNIYNEFSGSCLKECPLESCYSEEFTPSIVTHRSSAPYTYFYISFIDLNSLNITQIPKVDGFTFINNIGGGLGLFMGIAFPNLVEFVQFIVEVASIAFIV